MKFATMMPRHSSERGSLLILAVLFLGFSTAVVLSSLRLVSHQTRQVRISNQEFLARLVAQSGVHRGIAQLRLVRDMSSLSLPFGGIDHLDGNPDEGPGAFTQLLESQAIRDGAGDTIGEYDLYVDVRNRTNPTLRDVVISSYSYVPSKAAVRAGMGEAFWSDAHCTVRVQMNSSQVFDYSYFINHWGWFFGDNIVTNGSIRSNGQFDFGGFASTVNGSPRYRGAKGTDLLGYLDDNEDGITDGSDGGIYSGFQILNQSRVRGMGGFPENQHSNQGPISMPNLSNLTHYESRAAAMGSTIEVDGITYVDGVLGDDPSEKENLYLVGTEDHPIVINGQVVVRGSVILSGYVTGSGAIYSGGNIYVPKNLIWKDPPSPRRPTSQDEASVEAWLRANMKKDLLGLFAREHIVIGDYTNWTWQNLVKEWVDHDLNKSEEDAGIDGVQNTRDGPDGIPGTADDDVLEDDGIWTVSKYTDADADAGLIPPGKTVGDVIPGSGEDIDGDGLRDGQTKMHEFDIPASLKLQNWVSNNLGNNTVQYNTISTVEISQVDAVFYTNHTLAGLLTNWGGDIQLNGSIISRNESIIYGANRLIMNHDERLTGRNGEFFGLKVPESWDSLKPLLWEFNKALPMRQVDPETVRGYLTSF